MMRCWLVVCVFDRVLVCVFDQRCGSDGAAPIVVAGGADGRPGAGRNLVARAVPVPAGGARLEVGAHAGSGPA